MKKKFILLSLVCVLFMLSGCTEQVPKPDFETKTAMVENEGKKYTLEIPEDWDHFLTGMDFAPTGTELTEDKDLHGKNLDIRIEENNDAIIELLNGNPESYENSRDSDDERYTYSYYKNQNEKIVLVEIAAEICCKDDGVVFAYKENCPAYVMMIPTKADDGNAKSIALNAISTLRAE